MRIEFRKMHGLGNDFMVIDAREQAVNPATMPIAKLADRRTGVGFDQLLVLDRPDDELAHASYRVFNADGIEVEQCGNGVRCLAWLIASGEGFKGPEIVLAGSGNKVVAQLLGGNQVRVCMGEPDFRPAALPFEADDIAERHVLEIAGKAIEIGAVSMGNPHAVVQWDALDSAPVNTLGAEISVHPRFPRQTNVEFMHIADRHHISLRVFERGVGETRACGSGACAAMAVGRRWGVLEETVAVTLPGGTLEISWSGPGTELYMAGPAEDVYGGYIEL